MPGKIRLSQCMIVKNEEENIVRALSWGRGTVDEQIVVDTGSTDKTIELAESMGAKVFRYQWNNSFSEAKNYAIDQASGDWIFFLDADEYFLQKDMEKLKYIIKYIDNSSESKSIDMLRFILLNIDDDGHVITYTKQDRIFRNRKEIRFKNRIHECLYHSSGRNLKFISVGDEIPVFHTGYSTKAYLKTKKAERNIEMLEKELLLNPENGNIFAYLGDSFTVCERLTEAFDVYWKAANCREGGIDCELRFSSIANGIKICSEIEEIPEEYFVKLYDLYRRLGEEHPDVEYWTGVYMAKYDRAEDCIEHLEKALKILAKFKSNFNIYVFGALEQVYMLLVKCYMRIVNKPNAV